MNAALLHPVPARLRAHDHTPLPVGGVQLTYRTDDPFAVELRFPEPAPDEPAVRWTFARDLLREGLHGAAGIGDVRLAPCAPGWLRLTLSSPYGQASVELHRRAVRDFVRAADDLVPPGTETTRIDLDALTRALLPSD
ncbi:SsgA family sporulation/cell division regulator [Streptomyces sp. NPDC001941]|uniref:SsgA family sporulation/cell division regulator n=1 Tax=Streptomyces sp. NPDC001941 TaxID=3154659 RepID=UPI00331BF8AD